MNELDALTELTVSLVSDPRMQMLFGLLLLAAIIDARQTRIPNWLCFSGTVIGLVGALQLPLAVPHGLWWALQGLLTGLAIMVPLWLIKAIGAGDAKLAAMAGVFLGPGDTLFACLSSFIVAGVLTFAWCAMRGSSTRLIHHLRDGLTLTAAALMTNGRLLAPIPQQASLGRLPFAVSFALGTLIWVALNHFGLTA